MCKTVKICFTDSVCELIVVNLQKDLLVCINQKFNCVVVQNQKNNLLSTSFRKKKVYILPSHPQ